jgi:hypothetical protein
MLTECSSNEYSLYREGYQDGVENFEERSYTNTHHRRAYHIGRFHAIVLEGPLEEEEFKKHLNRWDK